VALPVPVSVLVALPVLVLAALPVGGRRGPLRGNRKDTQGTNKSAARYLQPGECAGAAHMQR